MSNLGSVVTDGDSLNALKSSIATPIPPCTCRYTGTRGGHRQQKLVLSTSTRTTIVQQLLEVQDEGEQPWTYIEMLNELINLTLWRFRFAHGTITASANVVTVMPNGDVNYSENNSCSNVTV